jgi:uncharacterized protein YkuJ
MEASRIVPIVHRLEAMIEDKTDNLQVRSFEVNGVERAQVTYDHDRKVFILNDLTIDIDEIEFDNIDYLAMEILELTQPVLRTED